MVGPSCRTRGICEGTLYVVGQKRPLQVMDRLKRHGAITLMDLERLLVLLDKKGKDGAIINTLLQADEDKVKVATLEELKGVMGEAAYNRVTKRMIE